MSIHSKILVHWTGKKDIEKKSEDRKTQLYIERLKDYCQHGLFLRRSKEPVLRGLLLKNLLRLCFTEIRLSQAKTHAENYGELGIGFARDFIIDRGGRPVIYIPFRADKSLLEDSLKKAFKESEGKEEIHKSLKWVLAYVKRMSNSDGGEEYYNEMEWRIVYDENPALKYFQQGEENGSYRFKFGARDVKIIIFPNEETKQIATKDEYLKKFFIYHAPTLVTLEDCSNF